MVLLALGMAWLPRTQLSSSIHCLGFNEYIINIKYLYIVGT